ncbi:MAG TPA: DUF4249 domain-containing protein [Chryseolinea sp.]|nr:DUF4249 domain-containing protein [Chryseolinea sp.]
MISRNLYISAAIALVFFSCDEPVRLDVSQGESFVVIEGQVTNVEGRQYVKLSRTGGFYDTGKPPQIIDGAVIIKDDAGNEFNFVHNPNNYADSSGYYLPSTPFIGEIGRTYSLHVTVDDRQYEAQDKMARVTSIDSLTYRVNEDEKDDPKDYGKFYEVLLYAKEPQDTDDYYLFKFFRNDSLKVYDDNEIYLADDVNLGENIDGIGSPIYFAPGDQARCEIYSLSRTAFIFYRDLQNLLNNDGGLFSQPPANSRTNLSNGAIGFFQASALHVKEIAIKE